MMQHAVLQLIHGHTHRPGVHTLQIAGQPARRYVLGDWYDQGSMLECDRDGCRLQELGLQG
jgi:UDP-2,3-diacylglucosamine hydrolase